MNRYRIRLFFISIIFFILSFAPVYAADVSFDSDVKHTVLQVFVNPYPVSLNIFQGQIRYDPESVQIVSCDIDSSFSGIAGRSACSVDASGIIRIQVESNSAKGPREKKQIAQIHIREIKKGSMISLDTGALVIGENEKGESVSTSTTASSNLRLGVTKDNLSVPTASEEVSLFSLFFKRIFRFMW